MRKIAVLTSGGDAPGMNAAIRAVTRSASLMDITVMGVKRGYNGLIHGDMQELKVRSVSEILDKGGTMLYTARCPEFKTDEGLKKAIENCKYFGIEGVVVIGGDGSFQGAKKLAEMGVPCIGIPGTIDNDVTCSEYTIGFDTAMNTATQMVDKLRDTAQSHDRCSVVEVMGRNCGDLALQIGIAVGATVVLIPEKDFDFEKDIIKRIYHTQLTGKQHFIIVVAEGVGGVYEIAEKIHHCTGIEARATILGHVQRGGSPTVRDRVIASKMGNYAVKLLSNGIKNRIVALQGGEVIDIDINEALDMEKKFDERMYDTAVEISI